MAGPAGLGPVAPCIQRALSIGAATATNPLGPYTDLGRPLINDTSMGMIDATVLKASNGTPYLVWKADGNAVGKKSGTRATRRA